MSVSITELIWQAKPRAQYIQGFFFFEVNLFSIRFLWQARFNRNMLAVPMASITCQQSLEIG